MKTSRLFNLILLGMVFCGFSFGQAITPQLKDGNYYFQVANVYFEVDPSFGARISSFKIDDQEILYTNRSNNWGATFWQSPQSEWGWPPSVELDQDPYTGGISGNEVILRSSVDATTNSKLIFKKTFSADLSDTSISIVYTMINKRSSAHSYSGWEVSRVPAGGISFFPIGTGSVTGAFASYTEVINEIVWYQEKNTDVGNQKFMCDGQEGWSAHVNDSANIFIKKFTDVEASKSAPGEKEVELYLSAPGADGYIELENQSEYKSIAVNDSVSWNMKWYARKLPSDITAEKGNMDMVNYVSGIISRAPVANPVITESALNIHPNPAGEYIILTNLPVETANLIIYDICGKSVMNKTIKNNESIQLKGLQNGIYFYKLDGINFVKSGKLIINK